MNKKVNIIQEISNELTLQRKVKLFVLRLDLLPTNPTGNKYFKLKYNIENAKTENKRGLLTFGGAFSNHILATAQAAKANNLKSIGIIRGEKPENFSPTLTDVLALGMELHFISRTEYRQKHTLEYLKRLRDNYADYYIIPEGGTNQLAVNGTSEILNLVDIDFDYIACSIGTGGTISGLCNSVNLKQKVLGFSALKGDFIVNEVSSLIKSFCKNGYLPEIFTNYHCGGYAKVPDYLKTFILNFYETHKIPLEPIYTAKMFYGLNDLLTQNYFPKGSTIVAVHTGGLQGLRGFPDLIHLLNTNSILK